MSAGRILMVVVVSALATASLGWLARAPYHPPGSDTGLLRLSWRLRGEKVESCRPRTQAELDALPVHMRTPEVCEGRLVAYRLIVQVDSGQPDTVRIVPGGARGDRPVFVLHDMPLAAGPHRVRVSFTREDGGGAARDESGGQGVTGDAPVRDTLAIETVLIAAPGAIHLITLSPDARELIHVSTTTQ